MCETVSQPELNAFLCESCLGQGVSSKQQNPDQDRSLSGFEFYYVCSVSLHIPLKGGCSHHEFDVGVRVPEVFQCS